jgi:hypothetical protein
LLILSHLVLASRKNIQYTSSCVTFDKLAGREQRFPVCINCLLVCAEVNQMQNRVRTVLTYDIAWKMENQQQQDE